MADPDSKLELSSGLSPDIWCDVDQDRLALATELQATDPSDTKRTALLLYEIGRVEIAANNERAAAKAFLKSYTMMPRFRPTLRVAQRMYRERADHRLAIKLLEAEARATRDPFNRTSMLRLQARVMWSRLQDLPGACKVLEEAQRLDAGDLATLKLLELLYAMDRDPDRLRSAILRQLDAISDQRVQVALLVDLAMLQAATDPKAAVDTLRSAERTAPGDLTVLCHLEQLFELESLHADLAAVIERQAADEDASPSWRARQLARAARIRRDQIKDPDTAADLFVQSMALEPLFSVAADSFDLLLSLERWAQAVEVGERLFELDDTPSMRASLACQLGDIHRTRLDQPGRAANWYEHCLRWCPTYQPALEGLGWILESEGEIDRLLKVHRTDLKSASVPRARAQRLYRIASLMERHDREAPAMEVHQEAVAADPDFQPSRSALERLYTRHERWTELLQLYDQELELDPDSERKHHILETMAHVWHQQLGNTEEAITCYRRILEMIPSHVSTIRTLARICADTGRWHDLVELNERELLLSGEPRRQVEILQRTGEVWEDQLLNLDQAMICYRRALEIDPRYLPALRALGRLLRQKGLWEELIEMCRAEIDATDDPEQITALLYDIAEVFGEHMLDEGAAAATFRMILERRPGHFPAITALERILRRQGDWAGLVQLMDNTLDALKDPQSKAVRLWRMGVLKEEQLCDADGAIRDYNRALRMAPDLAPAQAALEHILEEIGDHLQLADLFDAALEQTTDPAVRASIAHRLGNLWEHALGNQRKAALFYEKAAEASPTTWHLYSVAQIHERLGTPHELAAVLERLADQISDQNTRAELHLKIGRVKQQAAFDAAAPHFEQATSLSSGRSFALRAVERAARDSRRYSRLADLLSGRVATANDPVELACLWTELAELHLRAQDPAAAEHAFRQALGNSPGHLPASTGLSQLLATQERWAELAELAEADAEALESPRGIADALVRAAILWEEKAGAPERAVPVYYRVLEVQPSDPDAYLRLHRTLTASRDWGALASLIRDRISATNDRRDGAELFVELGRLYLEQMDEQRKGEACLRRTLELDPLNVYALNTLGELYYKAGKWPRVRRMLGRLEPLVEDPLERCQLNARLGDAEMGLDNPFAALEAYTRAADGPWSQEPDLLRKIVQAAAAAGDSAAQVGALERLAESSPDPGERVNVRKEVARLAEGALENDELAVRALEEALVLDPLDIDAIERLAAIYGRTSNRSAANQHLQAAVAHHRVELARRPFDLQLYRQLGRIFQWQRQFDRLYCACVIQFHLGELEEVQQRFLWTHHRRCSAVPKGPLPRSRYEQLLLPEQAMGAVRDLLASAGRGLQKRAAIDPASLGIDKSVKFKKDDPLRAVCDEVAALLGGVEFDLHVSRTQPDLITAEMLTRPALILGDRVARNMITAVERFRIGRSLFLIAENALVLRDLSVRDIHHLLLAIGRSALPALELPLTARQPDRVDQESRTLSKLLPRKERKMLGTILPQLVSGMESVNIADFARALGFGANRAGLIAAGDPKVALEETAQLTGSPDSGPEMGDLLQYLVSEEYFTLRVELGIAPGSG